MSEPASPLRLRLPATSANLGPGFDALGLAMALYLTIDARLPLRLRLRRRGGMRSSAGGLKTI